MAALPITRVVLYKHGVGYFEREGTVDGEATLSLTFKQAEVSDVLKSLTVLDLDGGHIASVSYDSTKPLEQLLAEVALAIPDQDSLVSLLPQIKGARISVHSGVADPVEGVILGIDSTERHSGDSVVKVVLLSLLTDAGEVRSFDLHNMLSVQLLDPALRRDLDFYLRTQLSSKKKDARTFTFFAQGEGQRAIRLSYTLEAPVWKATYRMLLAGESESASTVKPMIQGWAVVDNMQDEDWEDVRLSLISGLPVSFVHDLYTPRYIRRPEVKVQETTGVLPPMVEECLMLADSDEGDASTALAAEPVGAGYLMKTMRGAPPAAMRQAMASSTPAQTRERKIGDLFEYEIEHPVTIRRNQSALVPIVLREFEGQPVLLYNKQTRAENPLRCVEFRNTTGLTLEGGPVTVLEGGSYVGEAMLETMKPDEQRLVPYAVELSVFLLDNIDSHDDRIHRVVIRRGQMKAHYIQVRKTTYHCNNKSHTDQVVFLEHPRLGKEWKLFDTPNPQETTENHWRFRFLLPARKVTPFVIVQKQVLHQVSSLSDVTDQQLKLWLDQRYLDSRTEKALRQVMDLRREIANFEAALQTLENERARIHAEQGRIRENLQALGDRPSEKDLRERFVRTLHTQEDRLEQIRKDSEEKTRDRDENRGRLDVLLTQLEYDADVT